MGHKEQARSLFCEGYNCAQAVFAAFCDVTGMEREQAMRLSSSFGGGMGRMREVCGACSAMFMVAGLLYGYTGTESDAEKAAHYKLIQTLADQFKERTGTGTILCRELLRALAAEKKVGADSTDPGKPTARTEEFYRVRPCVRFVECAAELLDELIETRQTEL